MNILIRNATIIPMTKKDYHYIGSISISDGKIVAIGEETPTFIPDTILDSSHMIALPGLINAHTHVSMTYLRNYRDEVSDLHQWLSYIWEIEDKFAPEDIYPASLLGIAEMIKSGITCFSDMYFFQEQTCKAVLDSKIKAHIGLSLVGDIHKTRNRLLSQYPILCDYRNTSQGLIAIDIAPHAIYTCTTETLKEAAMFAQREHVGIHMHASETQKEVADAYKEFQMSPIAYIQSVGLLEERCALAHCVHLSEDDISILEKNTTFVIHNASSNCKLASGIAPITTLRNNHVPIALGTDGAASNNTLNLFHEMRLCAMLSSVTTEIPTVLSPYEILYMATMGGALALGRSDECGSLEVGKDADIILVDTQKPHLQPMNNPINALIYSASSDDVDTVLCKGTILMKQRTLQTLDEKNIMDEVRAHWDQIKNR